MMGVTRLPLPATSGQGGRKTINMMTFSAFAAHYSIIPTFHYSMRQAES